VIPVEAETEYKVGVWSMPLEVGESVNEVVAETDRNAGTWPSEEASKTNEVVAETLNTEPTNSPGEKSPRDDVARPSTPENGMACPLVQLGRHALDAAVEARRRGRLHEEPDVIECAVGCVSRENVDPIIAVKADGVRDHRS
jgi:hypothetical protein